MNKTKQRKAEAGDFIEIDRDLCLVVDAINWEHEKLKGDLAVVLLKYFSGQDWMELAGFYQEKFEEGNYKIIPREEALRRLGE
jgi:hypothetical protein